MWIRPWEGQAYDYVMVDQAWELLPNAVHAQGIKFDGSQGGDFSLSRFVMWHALLHNLSRLGGTHETVRGYS